MNTSTALQSYTLGQHLLTNKIVMAPMTRLRAVDNIPSQLMATYYAQRATAGLIISEGVSPSPNGLGYARMPGIYTAQQIEAWKPITSAVHKKGGKIFAQLMHVGRIGHPDNLPENARLIAPSSVAAEGHMWTDQNGHQKFPVPETMDEALLHTTRDEFVQAARNAIAAGFDGVELHGANGYLLEQFLSPHTNQRTDNYGGNITNRARFVLEVAQAVSLAIGADRTGIRLSPFGAANEMAYYEEVTATYEYLAEQLNNLGVVYVHLADHSATGGPEIPLSMKRAIRDKFNGTLILNGGYSLAGATADIESGLADLIAFGRPFINNPDLVNRFRKNFPLNLFLDARTLYSGGAKGLIDYPVFEDESVSV